MSNYERFREKILQRRQAAAGDMLSNAPLIAYLQSDLIKRLAAEVGYQPRSPVAFSKSLGERSAASFAETGKKLRDREREERLRAKYLAVEAEQLTILDTSDPHRINIESITRAQQSLTAARWFLDRLPDVSQESHDSDVSEDTYRAKQIEILQTWRARLRIEHLRIKSEINSLVPQSIDLESASVSGVGVVGKLLNELHDITCALGDAEENLKTANGGKAVPEYSVVRTDAAG